MKTSPETRGSCVAIDYHAIIEAIQTPSPVSGLTHSFYRYPARFSPKFAEAAITLFTKPSETVYDPFMGGGTTLVEAMRLGRKGIGTDVNSLAFFVSKVKTTLYTNTDITVAREWVERAQTELKLTKTPDRPKTWISQGYQRNISGRTTWPIRKTIEIALADLETNYNKRQQEFIRCLLLKTTQWAIDCRKHHPSAHEFRKQLIVHAEGMIKGALSLREELCKLKHQSCSEKQLSPDCLQMSVQEIVQPFNNLFPNAPKLILTSPPYPGVHVLYHRWQVHGRKETPAPYWIANCLDGNGAAFYTFGNRQQKNLTDYFENMKKCYKALSAVAQKGTWLVQLVAFSEPGWQLHLFLEILEECGFSEVLLEGHPSIIGGRCWRTVPNRKFYADHKGDTPSSKEVLLVHRRS
jgi:hypothetical protein